VFLPCVTGNHGRNTMKMRAKDRHHTSFDWMLYTFLAKHFEGDRRVTFYIPDGPDAFYRIYEHKYLLTHGDQFRGGDGIIGALGPLTRGNQKKHSRNSQIDMAYDTMICGHWHQDIFLRRLIVNGSPKGYDEYAYANNFGFEPPSQQLWVTHPKYRITYRMPVQVERQKAAVKTEWVSLAPLARRRLGEPANEKQLIVVGFPYNEFIHAQVLTLGRAQGISSDGQLVMTAAALPGNSGGGVFVRRNGEWQLVGILVAAHPGGTLTLAVDLTAIRRFL
jgi:hypothetical protein